LVNLEAQAGVELECVRAASSTTDERAAVVDLLERLSFNFSATPTWIAPPRVWMPFPVRMGPRTESVRTFDLVQTLPVDDVLARFDALSARWPRAPYPLTHRAELLLWHGRYAEAEADCRRSLAIDETARWAWVVLVTAQHLQGRANEALESATQAVRHGEPGPPMLAARGEAHLRAGHHEAATRDLRATLAAAPTRVSAWLLLATIDVDLDRTHLRFVERMPALAASARRDRGLSSRTVESSHDEKRALLAHALTMMRGNRSSQRVTWFPRDAEARVLRAVSLGE
jgi:tetratricopeptide (TPR) repeat protein